MNSINQQSKLILALGSLSAGIGVAAGAFGAHGLKSTLTPEMLGMFETAVRYQMYHAFGLAVTGLVGYNALTKAAAWCFGAGTILFSGSLYALTLSGVHGFGIITPIGGIAFIAGWMLLAYSLFRKAD